MPTKKRVYFPRVKEAREALRDRAIEILESYIAVIAEARAAGDFESATKSLQWLIEHMPEEDGSHMVDISIDKPKQVEAGKGPTIQIGFALGGLGNQKTLPAAIDVTPVEPADE